MPANSSADDVLSGASQFSNLSLLDLLEARDLFHVQLLNKRNVVATALGRYLVRDGDPWPQHSSGTTAAASSPAKVKGPRRLDNSHVRDYSWPCVLVFVERWAEAADFLPGRQGLSNDDFIPPAIYMPDGRKVPVCVVEAPRDEYAPPAVREIKFASNLIGGGYPVIADVQQEEHIASIGCMVTDGHKVYALTNHHVSGAPGEIIYSLLDGKKVPIGKSSRLQLTRKPFPQIYPGWPGKEIFANLDIGLIDVNDLSQWTAQVYGIGQVGKVADLNVHNLSLRLIGCNVRAHGCASGQMFGRIAALFYRYKSIGGFEYVSDFLVGPQKEHPLNTNPGDSGTVWLLETNDERGLMPLAVQWGGHVFMDGNHRSRMPYALATCLSTVCNLLGVDVVRDWNIGQPEYWGAVGHYAIANKACDALDKLGMNGNLATLMRANLDRITFNSANIQARELSGLSKKPFIPLADVPDLKWKIGQGNRGQPEHPNHFADMDHPSSQGTLLQICKGTPPENVDIPTWRDYYTLVKDKSRGLLPFRVWQFYDALVDFVSHGQVEQFVCAAGILSHYVGDACQPLHISYMFNGDPATNKGTGVHSAYEDGMVNYHTPEILAGVDQLIAQPRKFVPIQNGQNAAQATVQLMQTTFSTIRPPDIVEEFVQASGNGAGNKAVADALWNRFGQDTIQIMAAGAQTLAYIWNCAWQAGHGDINVPKQKLVAVDEDRLITLYSDPDFLPSKTLDTIGPLLQGGERAGSSGGNGSAKAEAAGREAEASLDSRPQLASRQKSRRRPRKKARAA